MIPLQNMRESLEKTSGILEGTAKFIWKHPKTTLGVIGGAALLGALYRAANASHGAYTMWNEDRKRETMLDQEAYLRRIAEEVKQNPLAPIDPATIPIIEPRSQLY